jgi:hypothetical protein
VANSEGVRLVLLVGCCVALAGCGGGSTTTVTVTRTVERTRTVTVPASTTTATTTAASACLASALSGEFAVVPGSAGAGQISYRLRLTNQGDSTCFVSGIPAGTLLGQDGARLPTNIEPAQPGAATAVRVDLSPGDAASAEARFSPDVPGEGEGSAGQCEDKAYTFRVTIGAGSLDAAVKPPTPVCERGSLVFSTYTAAR